MFNFLNITDKTCAAIEANNFSALVAIIPKLHESFDYLLSFHHDVKSPSYREYMAYDKYKRPLKNNFFHDIIMGDAQELFRLAIETLSDSSDPAHVSIAVGAAKEYAARKGCGLHEQRWAEKFIMGNKARLTMEDALVAMATALEKPGTDADELKGPPASPIEPRDHWAFIYRHGDEVEAEERRVAGFMQKLKDQEELFEDTAERLRRHMNSARDVEKEYPAKAAEVLQYVVHYSMRNSRRGPYGDIRDETCEAIWSESFDKLVACAARVYNEERRYDIYSFLDQDAPDEDRRAKVVDLQNQMSRGPRARIESLTRKRSADLPVPKAA